MIEIKLVVAYIMLTTLVFATGAVFGSLLGVFIDRLPRGIGLWAPRSFCLHCKTQLAWYDLLPVISYGFLRGRCRYCRTKIPPNLLFLEIVCGVLLCLLVARWGNSLCTIQVFVLCWLLLGIAHVDAQTGWMPLHLLLLLLFSGWGFGGLVYLGVQNGDCVLSASLLQRMGASCGALVVLGSVLVVSTYILRCLNRIESQQAAMGWGDPLLLAGIGAHVGLFWLPAIVFLASIQSVLLHVFYRATKRQWTFQKWHAEEEQDALPQHAIPFGPFLAAATWQTMALALVWPTWL